VTTSLGLTIIGALTAGAVVYLLPVVVGWVRRVPDLGSIAVIDLLLGWTLIGWVAALAMACRSVTPPGPVMPPARPGSPPPLVLPRRPPPPGSSS
jgi:hypothetical protein